MANKNTKAARQHWRDTVLVPAHKNGQKMGLTERKSARHDYTKVKKAFEKQGGYGKSITIQRGYHNILGEFVPSTTQAHY